ncbi:hypothetical protein KBB41_00845 [Candidatus Curtissbacteria bacterium]|nr:hypothetical protein [Candidatus Curtissbacteria bacterium]
MKLAFIIVPIISIILGVGTGFVLAQATPTKTSSSLSETKENSVAEHTEQVQQKDAASFRDKAEGVIEKNDASDGENFASGTHKLIRGDESQTAYLTSSVLDLNEYVGQKVTVYGETFSSSQVGWLMDVGRVEASQ